MKRTHEQIERALIDPEPWHFSTFAQIAHHPGGFV
jgi:hypothetical protein